MTSAASRWSALARFVELEQRIGLWARSRGTGTAGVYEFIRFGVKQAWACLFGALLLALILGTKLWYPADAALTRYDFLFLSAVSLQIFMLWSGLETRDEAKAILVFHVVGTAMELFKTSVGSWEYPETNFFRIAGVPLFSGFMYATVGSYISRVWRLFDFRFTHHPSLGALALLAAGIYANFFFHHVGPDLRIPLFIVTAILFGRCTVYFSVWREHRRMPLLVGFFLVALFIWFAENLATAGGAWLYPSQHHGWHMVPFAKLSSWYLLMIVSYTLVAATNGTTRVRSSRRP